MPAYAIFIRDRITNQEEMDAYAPLAQASIPGHPLKALAFYGKAETLEGPHVDGVVLLEFPTIEDAHAWYDSPAYQKAKPHRVAGSEYRVVIVQGL